MLDATEKFRNIIAKEIEKFNATYGSNYQQERDNFQIWKGKPGYSILASPDLGITAGLDAGFVRDDFLAVILK
ncbi:hypothetical protein [Solidesulfovibrio magneticus]|uniref:hypothetical protein n=1 Tax=Solidesulfovibrio magneticus TaxID=184917 RepID=UPI0005B99597|nr:hypothetical protein [Solidesulfovibrio magneticus]